MTPGGPLRARLPDGRWHFQHGPIDLVIDADGDAPAVDAAHEAAWNRFATVLEELVAELPALRTACTPGLDVGGPVARRMLRACRAHASAFGAFITPMAAVAGGVADEIVASFERPGIARAYVNNGGDIALALQPDAHWDIGVVTELDVAVPNARLRVDGSTSVRGVATSGWRGRSFSLGIADAVTVLADDAASADAAATMIANAVDVDDPAIRRAPACRLRDDTDLGALPVTVEVPMLDPAQVEQALARGAAHARACIAQGLARQALLSLQGRSRIVTSTPGIPDAR